ncbi:MAG: MraY family glycosyltransferase [Cyclobacteriaceae bacterium]|jgi:UDP-GlcNAc:undecaprenyl-phosphate GlcNAc-1-phosphate transferase|nr:MraY family glycosyltransferase [Cyclobacteriaceae bacterium]
MATNLAAAITAFVISFLTVPIVIKYSFRKNLGDVPGRRKIHKKVTPSLGGIAIFFGFIAATFIWIGLNDLASIKFVLVALFMVFFIGVRDDLIPIKASLKLVGQILAACLVVFFFDIRLKGLYGILAINEIPLWLSYFLTILTIIVITNAFNLIDGLDGLAGTISSIALLAFGIWFYLVEDYTFSTISFCMLGGILAFLIFNWEPSEVFMGDTGALVIGLMLSILTIHFINFNFALATTSPYYFKPSVTTGACFIIIPLIDTCRIIILRLSKKQSPFTPDKSHIHHAIMRLGMSHQQTTIILATTHVLYIGLALILSDLGENYALLTLLLFSIALSVLLDQLIIRKKSGKETV